MPSKTTQTLAFRCPVGLAVKMQIAAEDRGISISEYLREIVVAAHAQKKERAS